MKNNRLKVPLFFLLVMGINLLQAQEVISTAGNHDVGNAVQVSWTIGEPVIETGLNGQYYLTQGMHQGDMVITAISWVEGLDFEISAFPNPVANQLKLKINTMDLDGLNYVLYSSNGQLLNEGKVEGELTTIPMEKYRPATFLLTVRSEEQEIKVFKIVKRE